MKNEFVGNVNVTYLSFQDRKRFLTTFVRRASLSVVLPILALVTVAEAKSESIVEKTSAKQGEGDIDVTIASDEKRSLTAIDLSSRGVDGKGGSFGSQKVDSTPGGSIRLTVDGQVTLEGSPATVRLFSRGADGFVGANSGNYSARPGKGGHLGLVLNGTIAQDVSEMEASTFVIELLSQSGNAAGMRTSEDEDVKNELVGLAGGDVTLDVTGGTVDIAKAAGIALRSYGGKGAGAKLRSFGGDIQQSVGYVGGQGGHISATLKQSKITTAGIGLLSESRGAQPDVANDQWDFRPGGAGGDVVTILRSSLVQTNGRSGHAVVAQSLGGDLSNAGGGFNAGGLTAFDGNVFGGDGGPVNVSLDGTSSLKTNAASSVGIFVQSSGGGGAQGNSAMFTGGDGGDAGSGGRITVRNAGSITTQGRHSHGVFAAGIGGGAYSLSDETEDRVAGGGSGGSSSAVAAFFAPSSAGSGGNGGNGAEIDVFNHGLIESFGDMSAGIRAQSVGGNGGEGGTATSVALGTGAFTKGNALTVSVAHGGAGGAGGDGRDVSFSSKRSDIQANLGQASGGGSIRTHGSQADALSLSSIGGGGGVGGTAVSISATLLAEKELGAATSYGGTGGSGGHGGMVNVQNEQLIETSGLSSNAINAMSIGGGGGSGGFSLSTYIDLAINSEAGATATQATGGKGGDGGDGGAVWVANNKNGVVRTQVGYSSAITASSTGGGGGRAGDAIGATLLVESGPAGGSANVTLGGRGGKGGKGGSVFVENHGIVEAGMSGLADYSFGIQAQSVGGGGGTGGMASSVSLDLLKYFAGGDKAKEMQKQQYVSKSGVNISKTVRADVSVGGDGGNGNVGGYVRVRNTNQIQTAGSNSAAVFAQSVGGGGGVGMGTYAKQALNAGWTGNIQLGGSGGSGNHGGEVHVWNDGQIKTIGSGSAGIYAQSIGGGGGKAGSKDEKAINPQKMFEVADRVVAWKDFALEMKAKSDELEAAKKEKDEFFDQQRERSDALTDKPEQATKYTLNFKLNYSAGGDGGAAGNGGKVTVNSSGIISTQSDNAVGVFAQSVGGGGGDGGVGAVKGGATSIPGEDVKQAIQESDPAKVLNKLTSSLGLNVGLGGDGGARGDGGDVSVTVSSRIQTLGAHSAGIFAQSIGGGGGIGGGAVDKSAGLLRFGATVGGNGSQTGGNGGNVNVTLGGLGGAQASIITQGAHAPAIRAQSIGGGGGTAQLSGVNYYEHLSAFQSADAQRNGAILAVDAMLASLQGKAVVEPSKTATTNGQAAGFWDKLSGQLDDLEKKLAGKRDELADTMKLDAWGVIRRTAKDAGFTVPDSVVTVGYSGAGDGAAGGNGGTVGVDLSQTQLQTAGDYASAIELWSIGGGGGLATALTDTSLLTLFTSKGHEGAPGDGGQVTVTMSDSSIVTTGLRSHGLSAQSIGGGGGFFGEADLYASSQSTNQAQGKGNGGDITITASKNMKISTAGDYAHGIFAVSAGGGFSSLAMDDELVVLATSSNQGKAGDISIKYSGTISAAGKESVGLLAVSAGTSTENAVVDVDLQSATVTATGVNQAIGIIGQATGYQLSLSEKSTVNAAHGYAIATATKGTFDGSAADVFFKPDGYSKTEGKFNEVALSGGSTLNGSVLLSGPSRLAIKDSSIWNPGAYSVIGGVDNLEQVWDQPVKFMREIDGQMQSANLDVQFNDPGQVALLGGSTLNPGGAGEFMTSTIHIGGSQYLSGMLWLAEGSFFEVDIGDENGKVVHDKLLINPGSEQPGSMVSGYGDQGNYNVKVRLLGLQGVIGRELVLAEANHRIMSGSLDQPLAINGQKFGVVSNSDGGERMIYQVSSVKFDLEGLDGPARSVARQLDDQLTAGKFRLESSMIAALGYYAGQEREYAEELAELAESGVTRGVIGRLLKGRAVHNNLHSCLTFVGDGLGLVEENCTYARVTGSDMRLDGESGSDSNQSVKGSQLVFGGQRQIGDGLFAGLMLGFGNASADSSDAEYRSTSESVTLGAVIKKRFAQKYEVAFSGTYSHGWSDSTRVVNSTLAPTAYLSGSNKSNEAGLRLRLSYYATTDHAYIKPYVDFDARYYQSDAFTETGNSPFAMQYPSMNFWTYTATPQLEVGTRLNTDSGVWRAYVSGGVALSSDDKQTMLADFVATSGGAPVEMEFDATPTMGIVKVGVEYVGKDDVFANFGYEGKFGGGVRQQSVTARVGLRF